MFSIGDVAIYPGRGVGKLIDILSVDKADGHNYRVYKIQFPADPNLSNGLESVLEIPFIKDGELIDETKNRMRSVISEESIEIEIYQELRIVSTPPVETWNRRYRDYMQKIGSGDCSSISNVLRELATLRHNKDLSFGERKMYDQALNLLIEEAAYAQLESNKTASSEYSEALEKLAAAEMQHEQHRISTEETQNNLKEQLDNKEISTRDYRLKLRALNEENIEPWEKLEEDLKTAQDFRQTVESSILSDLRKDVKDKIEIIFQETTPIKEESEEEEKGKKRKKKKDS